MTNQERRQVRRDVLRANRNRCTTTPLMRLGFYVYSNDHDVRDAPSDTLWSARSHILERLASLPENTSSQRRSTRKWLVRWLTICDSEITRQRDEETVN